MSVTRSRLLSGVRLLAGDLPDEPLPHGLPSSLIFEVLCDLETEMLRELDLSNQNRRVATTPMEITLTDAEPFGLNVSDFNAPAFAQLQVDSSSDVWYPVEIENHDSLLQAGLDGRLALAFTGTPPQGFLSWIPDGLQTLRVWYDRVNQDSPSMSESTELGSLYDSHLKLQAVAQVVAMRNRARVEAGLPIMQLDDVLMMRISRGEKQWKRSATMSRQQGQASKSMVFTPARYRRRSYPGLDRTRFFIP